jgi:hypothetical protein
MLPCKSLHKRKSCKCLGMSSKCSLVRFAGLRHSLKVPRHSLINDLGWYNSSISQCLKSGTCSHRYTIFGLSIIWLTLRGQSAFSKHLTVDNAIVFIAWSKTIFPESEIKCCQFSKEIILSHHHIMKQETASNVGVQNA